MNTSTQIADSRSSVHDLQFTTVNNAIMTTKDSAHGSQSPLFEPRDDQTAKRPHSGSSNEKLGYTGKPLILHQANQPYRYAEHEEMPRLPSTHPLIKEIENLNKRGIRMILNVIEHSKSKDDEVRGISQELQGKLAINYGSRITVGVVGDTGAGKSTFINTLLGEASLANMVTQVLLLQLCEIG